MGKRRTILRALAFLLCVTMISISTPCFRAEAKAAVKDKTLLLYQAQQMALSNSKSCKKKYNEIILQNINYRDAVKRITEKQRNMATFRWTPLLSFKFPEKPNLSEEMEFAFKPVQIESTITGLKHEMNDLRFQVIKEVNDIYYDAFLCQEKIDFNQNILDFTTKELEKNRYRLALGQAIQNDLDVLEKKEDTLKKELALLLRTYENDKEKLSLLMELDVTSGYRFKDAFHKADISRDSLNAIIGYTLDSSQEYYEARVATNAAYTNMETVEQKMRGQYGAKMNRIESFISQSKQGKEVDTAAFQIAYDQLLKDVDEPWQGNIWILFFKIPREWGKGQISGIRYVEDEPYLLYTSCLEYLSALKEKTDLESSIRMEVKTGFENLVNMRNSYESLSQAASEQEKALERLTELNRQGKAEYSELKDKQTDYEAAQLSALSALKDYNDMLTSFDRLTCGAITLLLKGESLEVSGSGGGETAGITTDEGDGPYYYIQSRIQDMKFAFGVRIPEDFEPAVNQFELWYGDTRIGERTDTEQQLIHLAIAVRNQDSLVTVRFFNDGNYVEECKIDPHVLRGPLNLTAAAPVEKEEVRIAGSYKISESFNLRVVTLSFAFEEADIAYYSLADSQGKTLYSEEPIPAGQNFTYLSVLLKDLEAITLKLYDRSKTQLYDGVFHTTDRKIMVPDK